MNNMNDTSDRALLQLSSENSAGPDSTSRAALRSQIAATEQGKPLYGSAETPPQSSQVATMEQEKPQESTYATVMGMATNYDVDTYKRFVGSLRASGFKGNIILVISQVPLPGVEQYLSSQNVMMKRLKIVDCSYNIMGSGEVSGHQKEVATCADPYPDLKIRWARFAILRDHLMACETCTGPVLVTDVRDTFFQRDPFGPEAPPVPQGQLQVFEEHRTQRTTHWLGKFPVEQCKKIKIYDEPMLCSGTTIGARDAMLRYLADMTKEMRLWMKSPDCCCNQINGDDQSIHNYLYYTGKLPYAVAIHNRAGLVHTVGVQGAMYTRTKKERGMKDLKLPQREAMVMPYTNEKEAKKGNWLNVEYDLTDEQGYFIDFNGGRSFVVHQFDRFGPPMESWVKRFLPTTVSDQ